MSRICDWCREPIAFLESQTFTGNAAWHIRCYNQAAEQRAAYIAECEDSEGFLRHPLPDELSKSETAHDRSEVISTMATAPAPTDAPELLAKSWSFPMATAVVTDDRVTLVPEFNYVGCDDCREEALRQIVCEQTRKPAQSLLKQRETFPEFA